MATGTQKAVYFDNDVLEEVQKREGNFSRNVNSILRKGLLHEQEGKERTLNEIMEELVRVYLNKKELKKKQPKSETTITTVY